MQAKHFLYQIIVIAIIWGGMAFYFNDLYPQGKIIFYVVTSWLLFLIVIYIRKLIDDRKERSENNNKK